MPVPVTVGRVLLRGGDSTFEAMPSSARARRHEEVSIQLLYDYFEPGTGRDYTRLTFAPILDEERLPMAEHVIRDVPGMLDDRKGTLVVPVRVDGRGKLHGSFAVDLYYSNKPWTGTRPEAPHARRFEGSFHVEVVE